MNKKILITYFEPFAGRDINISKEVVTSIRKYRNLELSVCWNKVENVLLNNISEDIEYIFLVGEASSYHDVTIELVARNIASGVDNEGTSKSEEAIVPSASNLVTPIIFNQKDLDVSFSYNAGKFLCNYTYYQALRHFRNKQIVFIHLPYPRDDLTIKDIKKKLVSIIKYVTHNPYKLEIEFYQKTNKEAMNIRQEVFIKEQGFEYEFDGIDYVATHFLIYKKDTAIGTCRLFFDDELKAYHLGRLAIRKKYRHQGIGTMLLTEVDKYLYKLNAEEVVLGSQIQATKFYENSRYKQFGEVYLDEGAEHIHMKKELI